MKKKIYIGLFIVCVIFMVKLPSIVKKITVSKLEETIGRKVKSGDFRYNYIRNLLSIEGLEIYEDNGEDIFVKFDSFDVNVDIIPLLKRKFYIKKLTLLNPNFSLKYSDGVANFDSILKKIATDDKESEVKTESSNYIKSIELENITVDSFTFYYNDNLVQGTNKFTLETPKILYENKNTILDSTVDFYENGKIDLNLEYDKDGILSGDIQTKEFLIDDKLYIVKALYGLQKLEGEIDSQFNFDFDLLKGIYNLKGLFALKDLSATSLEFGELFSIGNINGQIENFKINENQFYLKDIRTDNGVIDIENIKKYTSNVFDKSNDKESKNENNKKESEYPVLNIGEAVVSNYRISDEKIDVEIQNLEINDLGTLQGDSNVEFEGKFQNSEVNFVGEIKKSKDLRVEKDLDSVGVGGEFNIVSLNLKDIQPLIQEELSLNGNLNFYSKFNYLMDNLQMENVISLEKLLLKKEDIDVKLDNLSSNNTISKGKDDYSIKGEVIAKNGSLKMDQINFLFDNGSIKIDEVSKNNISLNTVKLENPWIKIIDKKEDSDLEDKTEQKIDVNNNNNNENDDSKENKDLKVGKPTLKIVNIDLIDGRLDYIDEDIKYNLRNIIVDINDFTTEKNKVFNGDITSDLTGNGKFKFKFLSSLEKKWDFSPVSLNIEGQLDIFNLNFLDFKKIISENLPNEIDNGKLNYNFNISLNKGKLKGENLIFVEDINIGKKTDVNSLIPLKLGVNILKDRDDNLKLNLPISGDFNNPKFKIYIVVLEALKNILVKAVASPADFILSAFNIEKEKDLFIEYEYLDSNYEVKDNSTLEKVVDILDKKEDIKIVFTIFTDKEIEKGLLNEKLREKMFFKRDTKDEILENKINELIEERRVKLKRYFEEKELGEKVEIQISDISRDKAMSSIELRIKN